MIKPFRYQLYVDNKVIASSDFLLHLSGKIYDSYLQKFVSPIKNNLILLDIVWNRQVIYKGKNYPITVLLARLEHENIENCFETELSDESLLTGLCLNPHQFKTINLSGVKWMKRIINKNTGEVEETYDTKIEENGPKVFSVIAQVKYLLNNFTAREIAQFEAEDFGVVEEALNKARLELMGKGNNKLSMKDFIE